MATEQFPSSAASDTLMTCLHLYANNRPQQTDILKKVYGIASLEVCPLLCNTKTNY